MIPSKSPIFFKVLVLLMLTFFAFTSCEEEVIDYTETFAVPIRIDVPGASQKIGRLKIIYGVGIYKHQDIAYNAITNVDVNNQADSCTFYIEDEDFDVIEEKFSKEELLSSTAEKPLVLMFGNHLKQVVATIGVTSNKNESIALEVAQFERTIYQVDWGDGIKENVKSTDSIIEKIEHRYTNSGIHNIIIRCADKNDVKSIDLNAALYRAAKINKVELNDLSELRELSLTNVLIDNITELLAGLPKLELLSFYSPIDQKVDLTANKNLKRIEIKNFNYEGIIGIKNFPELEEIGLYTELQTLDFNIYPKLTNLAVSGDNVNHIDISGNTQLSNLGLYCDNLQEINLSKNKDLSSLLLSGKNFGTLDLGQNSKIDQLQVYLEDIKSLKIASLNDLKALTLKITASKSIEYPTLESIQRFLIYDFRLSNVSELVNVLLKGQQNNPRDYVKVILPTRNYLKQKQLDILQDLVKNNSWDVKFEDE